MANSSPNEELITSSLQRSAIDPLETILSSTRLAVLHRMLGQFVRVPRSTPLTLVRQYSRRPAIAYSHSTSATSISDSLHVNVPSVSIMEDSPSILSKFQTAWTSFWSAPSATQTKKLAQLKSAEQSLLALAPQFDLNTTTISEQPTIQVTDTLIPKSVVPIKDHSFDIYDKHPDHYVLHGIHVQSSSTTTPAPIQTPLVLLHGYMNGGVYFYRNFHTLSRYFQNVHALDLLGWGASSRPPFPSIQTNDHNNNHINTPEEQALQSIRNAEDFFVESLEAWRKQQKLDKMILAGHSMGGYLSVAYCERYPQHVERLILISPVGVPSEPTDPQEIMGGRYVERQQTLLGQFYLHVFQNSSIGQVLRLLPASASLDRVRLYVGRRLYFDNPTEQAFLGDYLYHSNTLPGSGEYCLPHFLHPSVFAKDPLVHRIPKLLDSTKSLKSVAFLYGQQDWMDVTGGLQVQDTIMNQKNKNSNTSYDKKNDDAAVSVYSISRAGHLLMLDNPAEFSNAMLLSAGGSLEDSNNEKGQQRQQEQRSNYSTNNEDPRPIRIHSVNDVPARGQDWNADPRTRVGAKGRTDKDSS